MCPDWCGGNGRIAVAGAGPHRERDGADGSGHHHRRAPARGGRRRRRIRRAGLRDRRGGVGRQARRGRAPRRHRRRRIRPHLSPRELSPAFPVPAVAPLMFCSLQNGSESEVVVLGWGILILFPV